MNKLLFVLGVVGLSCGNPAGTDPIIDPNNPSDPIADLDSSLKNGARLRNKYIVASDGTVALGGGLVDTQRSEDCAFALADDGKLRCLPTYPDVANLSAYYNNSSCTGNPIAYSASCEAPKKYVMQAASSCAASPVGSSLYALFEITPPATLYSKSGTTCTAVPNTIYTTATGYRVYTVGTPIPASKFVDGTVMTQ
jgi:hypothetical protein